MLPLRARVDLGAMAMKGHSEFPKAPALLELHHQIVYCHIQDTPGGGVLPLCRCAVSVFYSPSRLDKAVNVSLQASTLGKLMNLCLVSLVTYIPS